MTSGARLPDGSVTDLNGLIEEAIWECMKKVSITKAKNQLSGLIDGLKGGSPVVARGSS
jgi:hypothetical protein